VKSSEKIDIGTVQQRTYESIRDAVIAGLFVPGEVVTLRALGERFGVSSMPVREALRRLVAEGAFEALPNHSARVPIPRRSDIEQITQLRLMLERHAMVLAAEHLSKSMLDQLGSLAVRMRALTTPKDISEYARLNKEFHFGIYRESRNPTLVSMIESLWLRMSPFVYAVGLVAARELNGAKRLNTHHVQIVECLRVYDVVGAEAALVADLTLPAGLPDDEELARRSSAVVSGQRRRKSARSQR
jgi:DNA-binding GntR family transcriptional regulator